MLFFKSHAAIAFAVLVAPAFALAQPAGGQQPAGTQQPGTQQPGARSSAPAAGASGELQTFEQKLSYAMGLNAGRMLQRQGLNPDQALFVRGFQDSYKESEALLTDAQIQEIFAQVQQQMQAKAEQAQKEMIEKWKQSWPEQPAAAEQATESGLKYQIVAKGEGAKPKPSDIVVVHYIGTLPDGTVFDSSFSRGEPAVFQLGRVIEGWTEGLQLMSKGAKYRFDIPAELAYGAEGNPPVIPANQNLIFQVELLDFMPANAPPGGAGGAAGNGAAGNPRPQ